MGAAMCALLALMLSVAPAQAGEIVLGAAGGRDFPTDQFWTGIQAAAHPDGEDKWSGMGRLMLGWGFADDFPMAQVEAGFLGAVPHPGETVRLGIVASAEIVATRYRLPLEFSDVDRHVGLIPGIELLVEFEFFDERPFVFGARGGVQSASSNYLCPTTDEVETCLVWFPAFVGGFYGRGAVTDWLYLEALIGPSPRIAIGYPF